ncbi:bifunctional lysylphosphatidylglycerol flippase/synthetase MprF [Paenibacillus sp. FSL H7-0716]|uniref:Phosphatidylglycerol lysyltransferase n=1 Tax=Paenibacillus odorifer TaxID=189426 RepID=A0A1R0Z403_9BACL|nr:bifunctional lysylphosphatidylglycerol flippase/synthetase MprF [Paenibacillus odorifer]AWV36259.1 lysyltransferase [Paenibacillus odorifer]OME17010.1 lysyltransferase [Paenibacillus odorifer]OME24509.1 lysyltransferase [Paenibacillus odorifer]
MHSKQQTLERFKIVRLILSIYRIRAVRALFPVAIIAFVYWEGQHELKQVHLGLIMRELRRVPTSAILQMIGFALLSVAVMSAYDYLIRAHFRLKVGLWSTFRYAWIANTFNNLIGFAGLAGVGLRTLLYKKSGVPTSVLTPAIVFLSPLMITGLSLLSWANIFGLLPATALLEEHRWLVFAVWGMALYLPVFVFVQRSSLYAKWINRGKGRTPWLTVVNSVGASFLEWSFAGVTFWTISSHLLDEVHFIAIFGIFTIAAIAGILSMAPGGIGAFDLIALLGLTQLGYQTDKAMAVLVIFRLFYYVIPWLIGLVLAALEIGLQGKKDQDRSVPGFEPSLNKWQKIWGWPGQYTFLSDLGMWALGKLVLASGLILLLSTAVPGLLYRLKITEEILPFPVMQLSHHLSVLIGFMLILLSRGITLRVHSAYVWTSVLLFIGSLFAVTKGFDYEEALLLLIVALILWISRSRFYRISAPISRQSAIRWFALTSVIALSYYLMGCYVHRGFLKHLPPGVQPEWLQRYSHVAFTAVGGLVLSWVLLIMWVNLRPHHKENELFGTLDVAKLKHFLDGVQGNTLTHTLFLGDKGFFWAQNDKVLLAFARVRDKLVVLGDPLGERSLMNEAISEFRQAADQYGLVVVFYQASPAFLSVYQEQGYRFFKLGEEAVISLDNFALSDLKNGDLQRVSDRFEREGMIVEITEAPHADSLLRELRTISDEWLNGRAEKGYSLGWFKVDYLQLAPIVVVRNTKGTILAFASIIPGYDQGLTLSVDLLRQGKNVPNGTVDYLLVCMLEWAKSKGYRRFNLGNTPLSSSGGQDPGTLKEEKLAHQVFNRGGHGHGYGFARLRRYKEKFNPEWEPRYLAYPASLTLPVLTLDLVRLVSRHPEHKANN